MELERAETRARDAIAKGRKAQKLFEESLRRGERKVMPITIKKTLGRVETNANAPPNHHHHPR